MESISIATASSSASAASTPSLASHSTKIEKNRTRNPDASTTYSDYILKQEIAPILGLEINESWEIVSEYESLVMVHYSETADMFQYGALRGVVLDRATKKIVSYSYPHATKLVSDRLSEEISEGCRLVKLSPEVSLTSGDMKIRMGFEGPLFHLFKWNGKVFHSTRRRLEAENSRWGKSTTFEKIFHELGGPSDEDLFDPTKKYSPYCHTFILNSPDVLVASKNTCRSLIYLGSRKMYSVSPYPEEEMDWELRTPKIKPFDPNSTEGIMRSPELTVEEANAYLYSGFYNPGKLALSDPRLLPGEFIIVQAGENMYRVESSSYNWRSNMRNNNPNFYHRFFELIDYSYLGNSVENKAAYLSMFPILTPYRHEVVAEMVKNTIVCWPQQSNSEDFEEIDVPETKELKLYNIWLCLLMAAPLGFQKDVFEFYKRMNDERKECIEWFREVSNANPTGEELNKFSKRAQNILLKTREFAENYVKKGESNHGKKTSAKESQRRKDEMRQQNIHNFLHKEVGSSLYRLIREMRNAKKPVETEVEKME